MTNHEFKKIIGKAFTSNGFSRTAKNLKFDGPVASVLVELQKLEYQEQYFINIGFWLRALGEEVPKKVEQTHMYFRMDRLFPQWRDAVIEGGGLSHPSQPGPTNCLAVTIEKECVPILIDLANSFDCLKGRFDTGGFQGGLVRKEARELLQ